MNKKLKFLIDSYLNFTWKKNPVRATSMGIHTFDHLLGDYTEESILENIRTLKNLLKESISLNKKGLTEEEKCDIKILISNIKSDLISYEKIKIHERFPTLYPEEAIYGCYILVIRRFAPLEFRAEKILSRMKQVSRILNEGKKNLKNPPSIYTQIAIETTEGGINFFKAVIPEIADKVPSTKLAFISANENTVESMKEYLTFLREDLLPRSNGKYAIGKELFEFKLKNDHMLDLDSMRLLNIGKKILKETEKNIGTLSKSIDPTKSWQEIVDECKKNHPSKDEVLSSYKNKMEDAKKFILKKELVSIPEGESLRITETPVFERHIIPYAAYMPPAPFEKEQEGIFYVTPIDENLPKEKQEEQLKGHNLYGIPITALHEAYPGHHLQLVHSNRVKSNIRKAFGNNVFIEGWALYCEEMMREQGFYEDKRIRLLQLKDILWRAARVVIDVKLHTGEFSFDEAVEFLVKKAHIEKTNAIAEVKRYTMFPTQPMSYIIGKLEILKMREEYKNKMGKKFSLKDFHNRLLSYGSLPTKLIRENLLREKQS